MTRPDPLDDALLRRVTQAAIEEYLEAAGWKARATNSGVLSVYRREDDARAEVQLPLRTDFVDYREMLGRVFAELARVERRSSSEVLRALVAKCRIADLENTIAQYRRAQAERNAEHAARELREAGVREREAYAAYEKAESALEAYTEGVKP